MGSRQWLNIAYTINQTMQSSKAGFPPSATHATGNKRKQRKKRKKRSERNSRKKRKLQPIETELSNFQFNSSF